MPDSGDGTDEGDTGDMTSAWESVYEARRKRKTVHDLVRKLREIRATSDDSGDRWADITGRDE